MKDTTLDRIRHAINVESVSKHYNFKLSKDYPRVKMIRSPLGITEDKTPSFNITDNGKGWNCFSSGLYGDWFTFIAIKENLDLKADFKQIADIAAKITNIPVDEEDSGPIKELNPLEKKWKDFTKESGTEVRVSARQYLKVKKGIDILHEAFKPVQMAFVSVDGQNMPMLRMRDQNGNITGFQKANKRMESGSKMGMYYERINKKEPIYVVEGFSDYLSMLQMGYKNTV